ncbi:DUF4348 domain-containing protein [Flavobacterium humidisoli]|uniref:DUF4348 domain-containing protein n=1 Tax=Flavobacterium humidisoli TaxID=2937442 RepID=A0ABY4LT22_9FLAO|nr:DUF4348 domain-containing protein [Flavobacterium humidisoli]UPZ15389.1 DUF4348 domain-containing protein [Flavobacterium humidisoli]
MKVLTILPVLAFAFIAVNCNKVKEEAKSNSKIAVKSDSIAKPIKKELPENFDEFNKKFHSDSIFQVSRVDFPIEGKHVSGFEQYNWTKKNWQFQVIPVAEKTEIEEYQHSLVKTDTLITERFWIPNSGFEVERQFKLINNKWFLIYYNDINL